MPLDEKSKQVLRECHPDLINVFELVAMDFPCKVTEGFRDEARQKMLFDKGLSHLTFPNSRHNKQPSEAVDAYPIPIDWKDRERFVLFAGFVLGVAATKGIKLKWGGDWDMDFQVKDNNFDDLGHFELIF
jgi:hypothetical protein